MSLLFDDSLVILSMPIVILFVDCSCKLIIYLSSNLQFNVVVVYLRFEILAVVDHFIFYLSIVLIEKKLDLFRKFMLEGFSWLIYKRIIRVSKKNMNRNNTYTITWWESNSTNIELTQPHNKPRVRPNRIKIPYNIYTSD